MVRISKKICTGFCVNNSITCHGLGFDTHQFAKERDFILGGVKIPFEMGLLGHSDADVLAHAITDAMLGAACMGDIGVLFPDTDEAFKDADSIELLREARQRLPKGSKVIHVDAVILCQKPKLRPYIADMQKVLSEALDCPRVNVKATTTEKMNAEGEGRCVSAQAICTLQVPE